MSIHLLGAYRTMLRIRRSEETIADLVERGHVQTPCHLSIGQEAIPTGVCAALRQEDTVWGGHRSHGHYLAKGGSLEALFAEVLGKATGCAGGRGGSMHLVAPDCGVLGTVPLVAATVPLAVGAAMAYRMRGEDRIAVAFLGDGATEEGAFVESLNLAALSLLPVVFVCEHNRYASHLHITERRAVDRIDEIGAAHGVPSRVLDGNDVTAVAREARKAVAWARMAGGGPTLLVCHTYRWRGHVGPSWDMDVGLQRRDELGEWLPLDPIKWVREQLAEEDAEHVAREVEQEVHRSLAAAWDAPEPAPETLFRHRTVEAPHA